MFISDEFERAIYLNVVQVTFPGLIEQQKILLKQCLCAITQFIASCYEFYTDFDGYIDKLRQNRYKDLRWLLTCIVPYIDQSKRKISDLTDLNELYSLRYDTVPDDIKQTIIASGIPDINFQAPKYVFSTLQYGRCDRGSDRENTLYTSIKFNERYLLDNYYLLLDTIKTTRYKLYINWIDILPYRLDNYEKSNLYLMTQEKITNEDYHYVDPIQDYMGQKIKDGEPIQDYMIKKIKDVDHIKSFNQKIQGLNIEDLYDTMSLDLYESIVQYKWLIFDTGIDTEYGKKIVSLIQVLDVIMGLYYCVNNQDWHVLTADAKQDFTDEWDRLVLAYGKNVALVNGPIIITARTLNTIINSIVIFFDRKFSKIKQKNKNDPYIPLDERKKSKHIDDYEERMKGVTREMILPTLNSIKHIDMYDFLRETLQGFKRTWYSKYLMTPDKMQIQNIMDVQGYKIINENLNVSFKNIYNFCKNLVHKKSPVSTGPGDEDRWFSQEYVRLSKTFMGLDDRTRITVTDRINNQSMNWFNIMGNIRIVMQNTYEDYKNDATAEKTNRHNMRLIYESIRESIAGIVFETMIMRGTLTHMIAANDLTNTTIYDISINEQKINLVQEITKKYFYPNNPYGKNSYYYLTNKPFNETGTFNIKVFDKPEKYDYFKVCGTPKLAWYLATAYHWIAQVGFCHRFIHNRVNYITGATGAGKSTQIPKMYVYFLKAIDHLDAPTVIITVPRTGPATNVSNFVGQELALPYAEFNETTGKLYENDNYYVQYKHMKQEHVSTDKIPKLRFITDGSVLQDVKDPVIKNKYIVGNQYVYLRDNKYDVIIVDEAHEHNTNMDMILTLAKNAAFYNNKLRLVIMSATMDADEPVYRRFYRDINDNRKYPLNHWIKQYTLDRINTERRFHISPPDQTTRFKITEYYRPGEDPDQIVKEIIENTTSGDILLFQPGLAEITKSILALNAPGALRDGVIAIPYHAQLSSNARDFVEKIDKNLKNLRIGKQENFSTVESLTVGDNVYDRAIIVATNVAEASITIDSLQFVVDTGIEKSMIFDFERRSNVLKPKPITEASRLQRKGRVGRVSPGTVYYVYEPGSMENNKKNFNIAIQDIHQTVMLDMLRDPDDVPIFTNLINSIVSGLNLNLNLSNDARRLNLDLKNLINKKNLNKLIEADYYELFKPVIQQIESGELIGKNKQDIKGIKMYIDSIVNLIDDHYIVNGSLYTYYGNDLYYDYRNSKFPPKVYFSGFDVEQLTDSMGTFYIVHPDELVIDRNIGGDVVRTDQYAVISKNVVNGIKVNKFKKRMQSNKIIVFWETLLNMGFIGINKNNKILKTQLGKMLQYCTESQTSLVNNPLLLDVLFFGYGLSTNEQEFEKIMSIVAMLGMIKMSINKLINPDIIKLAETTNKARILTKNMQNMIKRVFVNPDNDPSIRSDIGLIGNICTTVDRLIMAQGGQYNMFRSKYFENNRFMGDNIREIETKLPDDLSTGDVNDKDSMIKRDKRLNHIFEYYKMDILNIFDKLNNLIKRVGLNPKMLMDYVFLRETIRRKWYDMINRVGRTNDRKEINMTDLRKILKDHRNYMNELNIDFIKGTFMLAAPYSIVKKIPNTLSTYMSLYNPHPDTILTLIMETIPYPVKSRYPKDTFLDPIFYQDYVLYLYEGPNTESIGTLIYIESRDLKLLANIYNSREMRRKFSLDKIESHKLHLHVDPYLDKIYSTKLTYQADPRIYGLPEHTMALIGMRAAIDRSIPDIEQIQDSQIWTILNKLGVGYEDYGKILRSIL
jgi:hypothetical protein